MIGQVIEPGRFGSHPQGEEALLPALQRQGGIHALDDLDRQLLNALQDGLPICERPFKNLAAQLGVSEAEVVERIRALLQAGVLTRFGPMYNVERIGGAYLLAAMAVPEDRYEAVAAMVNAYPEIAHNYRRRHWLNMWFVVAATTVEAVESVCRRIEAATGLEVWRFPKEREYGIGLRFKL